MKTVTIRFLVAFLGCVSTSAGFSQDQSKYLSTQCLQSISVLAKALGVKSPVQVLEDRSEVQLALDGIGIEGRVILSQDEGSRYRFSDAGENDSEVDVPATLVISLVSAVAKPFKETAIRQIKKLEAQIKNTSTELAARQKRISNDELASVPLERQYFSNVGPLDDSKVALERAVQSFKANCEK